jgi:hypothetical protein
LTFGAILFIIASVKEIAADLVCIHGDNHGDWDLLFKKIDLNFIEDALLIGVGDAGIGFIENRKQKRQFESLNLRFKKRGIEYLSIRGNHDDPQYFNGSVDLSNFKLIPDYSYLKINKQVFLFVGGAVSIDRFYRKLGVSYWEDEAFCLKKNLIKKCDTLITHSCPTWVGPTDKSFLQNWSQKDPSLPESCLKERLEITELIEMSRPSRSYHGHMHLNDWAERSGCRAKVLDINEIIQHS